MSQLYSLSLINTVIRWILHTLKLCLIHIFPSTAINLNLNQLSGETSNSSALIKCWQLSRSLSTQTVSLKNFALHLKWNGSEGSCTRNSHRIYDYRTNAGQSVKLRYWLSFKCWCFAFFVFVKVLSCGTICSPACWIRNGASLICKNLPSHWHIAPPCLSWSK